MRMTRENILYFGNVLAKHGRLIQPVRDIVVMYTRGYPVPQIAAKHGMTEDAIRSRLHSVDRIGREVERAAI